MATAAEFRRQHRRDEPDAERDDLLICCRATPSASRRLAVEDTLPEAAMSAPREGDVGQRYARPALRRWRLSLPRL